MPSVELLSILPNLSIGVISICALVFVAHRFLMHLDALNKRQEEGMMERELALRSVESEVRTSILVQLNTNSQIMNDTSRVLERAVQVMDKM